jgi:alpha-2-macroglobulin
MARLVTGVLVFAVFLSGVSLASETPRVEFFSPEGTVKQVRQVTARFTDQMVAFGDPRLADPFDIKCSGRGKGRWVDGKSWSYDFDKDLDGGIVCTFTVKPALKALSGKVIGGKGSFAFNTGGPSVIRSEPFEGDEYIDENQRFIVTLDSEPDEASIQQHVYCSVEGIEERIGIRLVTGPEREDFLKAVRHDRDKRPTMVFGCRRTFPAKAVVKIVWGRGIKSKSGVATGEDQTLAFKTREPFTARFSCMRENPGVGCIPLAPMELSFTSPVPWEMAKEIILKSDQGQVWKPGKIEESGAIAYLVTPGKTFVLKAVDAQQFVHSMSFEGPFPENSRFTLTLPEGFKDDAGRVLQNGRKFPLKVATHGYTPLAKFADHFGIIEMGTNPLLPVTVRNIETEIKSWTEAIRGTGKEKAAGTAETEDIASGIVQKVNGQVNRIDGNREDEIIRWLNALSLTDRRVSVFTGKGQGQQMTIPKPGESREFEVIGIPLKSPGFYVMELESILMGSRLLSKPGPMYVPTSALVTNMTAHFKWGRESSLVWVTSLDKAEPVSDASVTIRDCAGSAVWQGKTDADGLARIEKRLPSRKDLKNCSNRRGNTRDEEYWANSENSPVLDGIDSGLFIFARKNEDMTFTHSSWDKGIDPWRFNLPVRSRYAYEDVENERPVGHTVFDRTLFRAGETVYMKHLVREREMTKGFLIPPLSSLPDELVTEHAGSEQTYRFPLRWLPNGTAETTWAIPQNAKLGTYTVYFEDKNDKKKRDSDRWQAGTFRVEEFRVPLMKAVVKGLTDPVIREKEVDIDISLNYLAGGGASQAPVKLRSEVRPKSIMFPGYEEFIFSNGHTRKGLTKNRYEEEPEYDEDGAEIERRDREDEQTVKLKTEEFVLNKTGSSRTKIADLPEIDSARNIVVELEFRDPNGETQTTTSRINFYPAKVHAGIALDQGRESGMTLRYKVVILDLKGKPLADREAKVTLLNRKTYSHRRRITGGFYAYESGSEVVEAGPHCQGKTDRNGLLFCEGKSPVMGNIILQVEAKDDEGRVSSAFADTYVYGESDQWFEAGNDDRIDVIPEKRYYEPGEMARFQLRMPFREATVLVTVEREGIMKTHIRKVSRSNPVVEIPMESYYSPNVFVSAFAVRGRIGEVPPTAFFDPGRPAYKLGIAQIDVGWQAHELKVAVVTDKKTYKVRETVEARISVKTALGKKPPAESEVTVAAVDEGLLELKENESWKLLEAMMKRRPYEVATSTAQMMVVGKRHFGKKALPQGGGGGKQTTRELFGTLLFWRATVPLDENGEAMVKIPLNDSLTSFRIVAVASGGASLFGTGMTSVSTTQDLMLFSGLMPLAREGDRFTAGFTVRNSSSKGMDIEAILAVTGRTGRKELSPIREQIPAGESREIGWDTTVPVGENKLLYEVKVADTINSLADSIRVDQKVIPAVPVRTFQTTTTQLKGPYRITVRRPDDAVPGKGGVNVILKPRLAEGMTGVREYMNNYPYNCFEQKVSRAVALRDEAAWRALMTELPSYIDGDGLVMYFPVSFIRGSDVLTSYVLSIAQEAGYGVPDDLKTRMMSGLKGFVEGRIVRWSSLPTADLSIRKIGAVEALSRYREAQKNLLDSIAVEPNLWPTSALLDWINILHRVSDIPGRDGKLKQAQSILRSRISFQGTIMSLSTEKSDYCWWLMVSPDTNAVRTLLTVLQFDNWNEDAPRIARGVVERLKKGHWNTTVSNALGVLAMEKFSQKYESVPVTGVTVESLGGRVEKTDWKFLTRGSAIPFAWPSNKADLAITHKGTGKPWVTIQSLAAIPLKKPLSTGYKITRTVTPVQQKSPGKWTRGDVARVHLEIDAQSDMTWVVVNDPVPAGSTILGSGLGRDSSMLTKKEKEKGWAGEVFRERTFEGLRVYFDYISKGRFTVEYTVRLNNEGIFNLPQTRVEALYSPEMFGETPNRTMEIAP